MGAGEGEGHRCRRLGREGGGEGVVVLQTGWTEIEDVDWIKRGGEGTSGSIRAETAVHPPRWRVLRRSIERDSRIPVLSSLDWTNTAHCGCELKRPSITLRPRDSWMQSIGGLTHVSGGTPSLPQPTARESRRDVGRGHKDVKRSKARGGNYWISSLGGNVICETLNGGTEDAIYLSPCGNLHR